MGSLLQPQRGNDRIGYQIHTRLERQEIGKYQLSVCEWEVLFGLGESDMKRTLYICKRAATKVTRYPEQPQ